MFVLDGCSFSLIYFFCYHLYFFIGFLLNSSLFSVDDTHKNRVSALCLNKTMWFLVFRFLCARASNIQFITFTFLSAPFTMNEGFFHIYVIGVNFRFWFTFTNNSFNSNDAIFKNVDVLCVCVCGFVNEFDDESRVWGFIWFV